MNPLLLTFPNDSGNNKRIFQIITDAILNADEIWWASAYLTTWPIPLDCLPKNNCSTCNIVVGSDFGITRKAALLDLLKWKKQTSSNVFINNTQGFHPKVFLWRKGNKRFVLAGSSNLSVAGWTSNIELNIRVPISKKEFDVITEWFDDYVIGTSPRLDPSSIKSYKESKRKPVKSQNSSTDIDYRIKKLRKIDFSGVRKQLNEYNKTKNEFVKIVKDCEKGLLNRKLFYSKMSTLLKGTWRGNSNLLSMNCKNEKWEETCSGLSNIFDANKADRDRIVKKVIDSLTLTKNKTRGSWLSEILCHHFPLEYPLIDDPVKEWIRECNIEKLYGIPTGYQYIRITKIMRKYLNQNKDKFNNFMEMDHAIWKRQYNNKNKTREE